MIISTCDSAFEHKFIKLVHAFAFTLLQSILCRDHDVVLLHNVKSHGPSSVEAKHFHATNVTIHFVNKALHKIKKENKDDKTGDIGSSWFDS